MGLFDRKRAANQPAMAQVLRSAADAVMTGTPMSTAIMDAPGPKSTSAIGHRHCEPPCG